MPRLTFLEYNDSCTGDLEDDSMPRRSLQYLILIAIAATVLLPSSLLATSNGFYVSWKFGSTDADADIGDTFDQVLDGDEDSEAYELGYRFTRFWAVQAAYHDFGSIEGFLDPCPEGAEVCPEVLFPIAGDTKAYSLTIVPQLPLGNRLSIFGKVGLVAWETEVEAASGAEELVDDFDDEDLIFGVGVRFKLFGSFEVFGEWESIASDIETTSVGLTFQF
jgi:hypothetical protein